MQNQLKWFCRITSGGFQSGVPQSAALRTCHDMHTLYLNHYLQYYVYLIHHSATGPVYAPQSVRLGMTSCGKPLVVWQPVAACERYTLYAQSSMLVLLAQANYYHFSSYCGSEMEKPPWKNAVCLRRKMGLRKSIFKNVLCQTTGGWWDELPFLQTAEHGTQGMFKVKPRPIQQVHRFSCVALSYIPHQKFVNPWCQWRAVVITDVAADNDEDGNVMQATTLAHH